MKILAAALLGAAIVAQLAPQARAEGTLRVCLEENAPPYSMHEDKESGGFDLAVAGAVAKRLGRELAIQWFETEIDEDSSLTLGANALMSDGLCQLVGGYPTVDGSLGKPQVLTARLPDHEGGKPADRRRPITLGTLVPSKPYHYAALTVVLGGPAVAKPITSLSDLQAVKIGSQTGTLTDAILMIYGGRRLVNQVTHVVPGPRGQLLEREEKGDYDATLVTVRSFDAYRAKHPDTKLKASGFYHRIGFNMGFVGLSSEQPLIDQVNTAIADMLAKGELAPMAAAAGMTYLAPHQPDVQRSVTLVDLFKPDQ
ncbi:MAG TPA: transporter substrate-binding domain-containing protein [Candidatus Cybelea sp.]|nr:transporter substrate-binding domain-containing protein [Candidatus Cybelea sp.]